MYLLGICSNVHISSAALCKDGVIVAAAAEERFTREKSSRHFPQHSIKYCLEQEGITLNDVDEICVANDIGVNVCRPNYRYVDTLRWYGEIIYQIPMGLSAVCDAKYTGPFRQNITFDGEERKITYISHHKSHMANAFYLSPFDRAAILTVDGFGEDGTCHFALGEGSTIKDIQYIEYPHSLGMFFGTITELLGYKHDSDEWKVMGMAAYGNDNTPYYDRLKKVIRLEENGTIELDLDYFSFFVEGAPCFNEKLISILCDPAKDHNFSQIHFDIARAAQRVLEDALIHLLKHLYKVTQCSKLVLAGGVFMNSLFNGKILKTTPFQDVFISSCPDDSGLSIGAALYRYYEKYSKVRNSVMSHNFFGPHFSSKKIEDELKKYKINYSKPENLYDYVAHALDSGKVVGWFQGAMEFGQRALGNRSILADPRRVEMKDIVNASIKYRESFRPFAPAVLEEDMPLFFEQSLILSRCSFMGFALPVKEEMQTVIPAVVHNDGTARVQSVSKAVSPSLHRLLSSFKSISGVGVLLNTSFNIQGEPIVLSPLDAIRTFYSSGIDLLVLEDFVIEK